MANDTFRYDANGNVIGRYDGNTGEYESGGFLNGQWAPTSGAASLGEKLQNEPGTSLRATEQLPPAAIDDPNFLATPEGQVWNNSQQGLKPGGVIVGTDASQRPVLAENLKPLSQIQSPVVLGGEASYVPRTAEQLKAIGAGGALQAGQLSDRVAADIQHTASNMEAAGVTGGSTLQGLGQSAIDVGTARADQLATTGNTLGGGIATGGAVRGGALQGIGQQAIASGTARANQVAAEGLRLGRETTAAGVTRGDELGALGNEAVAAGTGGAAALRAAAQQTGAQIAAQGGALGQGVANIGQGAAAGISNQAVQAREALSQYAAQQADRIAQAGTTGAGELSGLGAAERAASAGNLGQATTTAGNLVALEATQGPSAAQAQLRAGTEEAMANNIAAARSARGWGGSASALSAASAANAIQMQRASTAAAQLRAQENAAWRTRAAQNLGTAAGIQAGIGTGQAERGLSAATGAANTRLAGATSAGTLGTSGIGTALDLGLTGATKAGELATGATATGAQLGAETAIAGGQARLGGMEAAANIGNQAYATGGALRGTGASLAAGATEAGSRLAVGAQESAAGLGNQAYGTGGALYGEGANLATRAAESGAGVTLEGQKAAGALANQAYGTGGALYGEGTGQMVGAVQGAGQIALSGEELRQRALTQGTTFDFLGNQAATDIYSEQAALETEALNRILQERAIKAGLESSLIAARQQKEGALYGAAGVLGAGLLMSDVRAKTEIQPEPGIGITGGDEDIWGIDPLEKGPPTQEGRDIKPGEKLRLTPQQYRRIMNPLKETAAPVRQGTTLNPYSLENAIVPVEEEPMEEVPIPWGAGEATPASASYVVRPTGTSNPQIITSEQIRGTTNPKPPGAAATQALQAAPPYSYRYRDPQSVGAGPGRYVGPMAQDLERTPLGKTAVTTAPNGTKGIDTGRLTLINSAALSNMASELKRLRARVEKRAS